jgi:ABC transport system ATP-binding/permease protein
VLQNAIAPNCGADAQTLLFVIGFAAILFGCINAVREIVKELPIYRRERLVNMGIAPYLFSKSVVLGIFSLLQSALLIYLVNLKAPFQQGIFLPVLVEVYITMALTALAGLMLGLTLSAIAPNTDRAMSFVPLILIPQVIFSGILFKLDTPVLQAIGALFAMVVLCLFCSSLPAREITGQVELLPLLRPLLHLHRRLLPSQHTKGTGTRSTIHVDGR